MTRSAATDEFDVLESGAALLVGTVRPDGVPHAVRAWGLTLERAEDGSVRGARVVVGADDPVAVAALGSGPVAVTCADVPTLRSVQVKGRVLAVVEPTADDLEVAERQTRAFLQDIHDTEHTRFELLERMLPASRTTIVITIESGFDQTPGPGAGTPLEHR